MIEEEFNKKLEESNNFEKELLLTKNKNLIKNLTKKKFTKKIIYDDHSIYFYEDKITIYLLKNIILDNLYKSLLEIKPSKILLIKRKIVKKKIINTTEEFLFENDTLEITKTIIDKWDENSILLIEVKDGKIL